MSSMLDHFQSTHMWLVIIAALALVSVGSEIAKHIRDWFN